MGESGRPVGQPPALAVLDGQPVLAWPYADPDVGHLRRRDRYPAVMFGNDHDAVVVGRSKAHRVGSRMVVTTWHGRSVVAWGRGGPGLGSSLMAAQVVGGAFDQPVPADRLGGLSALQGSLATAVCSLAGELYIAWAHQKIGVGPCTRVVSTRSGTYQAPLVFPRVAHLQMCELGAELAAAWCDSRDIYVGFLRTGQLVPALRLRVGRTLGGLLGDHPLGLCAHDAGLVLTWGRGINVARIRRAYRWR